MIRRPPRSTLYPDTTLFRSDPGADLVGQDRDRDALGDDDADRHPVVGHLDALDPAAGQQRDDQARAPGVQGGHRRRGAHRAGDGLRVQGGRGAGAGGHWTRAGSCGPWSSVGRWMSFTAMFTSVTCSPVIPSTALTTLRRTDRAISAIGAPYSVTTSRSTAACFSPTSTDTPWPAVCVAPGMRSRSDPKARAAPPPRAYTPETSRAASPAIFWTTPSAMVVLPWLVCSTEGEAWLRAVELVVLLPVVVLVGWVIDRGLPRLRRGDLRRVPTGLLMYTTGSCTTVLGPVIGSSGETGRAHAGGLQRAGERSAVPTGRYAP